MKRIIAAGVFLAAVCAAVMAQRQANAPLELTQVLGRPTDRSITVSILSPKNLDACFEFGTKPGVYTRQTPVREVAAGKPVEFLLDGLQANTRYYYRMRSPEPGPENTRKSPRKCWYGLCEGVADEEEN